MVAALTPIGRTLQFEMAVTPEPLVMKLAKVFHGRGLVAHRALEDLRHVSLPVFGHQGD
jgi:hypothetical protein